jgi:broad specificity phosphatase PhoE
MSRIFLLRHAHSIANAKGILAGRMENIPLSKEGQLQHRVLLERLAGMNFDQVLSSPMQRCIETLSGFADAPVIAEDFQEVHYGDWTGKRTSSLMRNAAWREIHKHPASVRFPNGETLPEVQTRSLAGLDRVLKKRDKNVLISTHADVVKVLVLHALGSHLNNIDKLAIDNASLTIIDKVGNDFKVIKVNDTHTAAKELAI